MKFSGKYLCRLKTIVLFTFIFILAGCSSPDWRLLNSENKLSDKKSYIYGRFKVNLTTTAVYIRLKNMDTEQESHIRFFNKVYAPDSVVDPFGVPSNKTTATHAVKVSPGKYKITYVMHTFGETFAMVKKEPKQEIILPEKFYEEFEVKAGEAVYIGDFITEAVPGGYGIGRTTYYMGGNFTGYFTAELKYAGDDFRETTQRLIAMHPETKKQDIKFKKAFELY